MSDVSSRGALTIQSSEVCDRGKVREENQDSVRHATLHLGELFLVADGIGGYQGGATASRMVAESFFDQLSTRPVGYPVDQALQEACAYTNAAILQASSSGDPAFHKMGSTVVLALIQLLAEGAANVWIGHVGDSRAYLIRNGQMGKLTSDHSAVQALLSRNLITEEEARNHPDSSVLTRSLGHRTDVEIEIDHVQMQAGDGLLLCSDGLWGYVEDADIAAVAANAEMGVENIAQTLLQLALAAGGQDNIGIEFLRLEGDSPLGLSTGHAAGSSVAAPESGSAVSDSKRTRNMQFLAIGLLLLAAAGCLGYLAMHKWSLHNATSANSGSQDSGISPFPGGAPERERPHSSNPGNPAPGQRPVADKPHPKRKLAIAGEIPTGEETIEPPPGADQWDAFPITNLDCAKNAKGKSVVFSQSRVEWKEVVNQHPRLKERLPEIEWNKITEPVRKACGGADVVVILVHKQPIPSLGDGPSATPSRDSQDSPKSPPAR